MYMLPSHIYREKLLSREMPTREPQGTEMFSVAGRFRLTQVPEVWILENIYIHSAKHRFPLCPGSIEYRFNYLFLG
jgi:hypothetical protein